MVEIDYQNVVGQDDLTRFDKKKTHRNNKNSNGRNRDNRSQNRHNNSRQQQ